MVIIDFNIMKFVWFLLVFFVIILPFTFFIWAANEENKSYCKRPTDFKVPYESSCVKENLQPKEKN